MYTGGIAPKLISFPIQEYIDDLDTTNKLNACAGTDGDRYYLSLPISSGKILLVYDVRVGKWYVEDDIDIKEFVEFNNVLYGITSDGQIKKMIDTSGSETVEWYWISKPFYESSLANKKSWNALYFVVELPAGSTLECALSTSVSGDDFTTVKTFTTNSDLTNVKINIPLTVAQNADWVRIKLSGTGPCTVHAMEKQIRVQKTTYA